VTADVHAGAVPADPLGGGDRRGLLLTAGHLPGRGPGGVLEPDLAADPRSGEQHDQHHHDHHGKHDRRLRGGGAPVVPAVGRPGTPRHHAPWDRAEVMMPMRSSRTSPEASRSTSTAAKPQAARMVMAYSAVEAPFLSYRTRSRLRLSRTRV